MALTNMEVFSKYIVQATIETVSQQIAVFNEASGGAIILSTEGWEGDFLKRSLFQSLASAQRRVDRYAANGAVTPVPLEQIQGQGVKVAGGFGPVIWEPSQLTWMQMNEVDAIDAISKSLAGAIIQDQLNSAINAAVAAIGNNPNTVIDDSLNALNLTQSGLNRSHALFGDKSQALIAQVVDGQGYHTLIREALNNGSSLFSSDNVTVIDILGKRTIVTDAPALRTDPVGTALTLSEGGLVVTNASDLITNIATSNGNERIETTFQGDYTFGLNVKGYGWDMENGGKSPDDVELGTGTNWDQFVSSVKDTAGVMYKYDSTA